MSEPTPARLRLEREIYWNLDPGSGRAGRTSVDPILSSLRAMERRLRDDLVAAVPGSLRGGGWRLRVKRVLFSLLRPLRRRSDEQVAELLALTILLGERIERLELDLRSVEERSAGEAGSPPWPPGGPRA